MNEMPSHSAEPSGQRADAGAPRVRLWEIEEPVAPPAAHALPAKAPLKYTVLGFDIRAVGANARAAEFAAVPVTR